MAEVYGIANFTINRKSYSVSGTFGVKPAYFRRDPIIPINTTAPSFSEVPVPATITGTMLKPKDVKVKDILSLTDTTVVLVNGSVGKTFTLSNASQTGDGEYNPYNGELPITFVGTSNVEA